jgi:hypothetical protein
MGFWTKNKVQDAETARNIPQEQMKQQTSKLKESTLITMPSEYDVVESEDEVNPQTKIESKEIDESFLPPLPTPRHSAVELDDEEMLMMKLEKIRNDKLRRAEEQRVLEESKQQPIYQNEQSPLIYLTEAECLREILRKIDFLILEIDRLKRE